MVSLWIFSYLPNPRIWKARIAARLCNVQVEVRGASPRELAESLWDLDAQPIADLPNETLASTQRTSAQSANRCARLAAWSKSVRKSIATMRLSSKVQGAFDDARNRYWQISECMRRLAEQFKLSSTGGMPDCATARKPWVDSECVGHEIEAGETASITACHNPPSPAMRRRRRC
jgi:hypothetical protein